MSNFTANSGFSKFKTRWSRFVRGSAIKKITLQINTIFGSNDR